MIRAKSRRNYKNILYVLTLIRQPVEFFMTTHSQESPNNLDFQLPITLAGVRNTHRPSKKCSPVNSENILSIL